MLSAVSVMSGGPQRTVVRPVEPLGARVQDADGSVYVQGRTIVDSYDVYYETPEIRSRI